MPIKKQHINLLIFCLTTFGNALGFGIFYGSTSTFANYYNVSEQNISYLFYIGLIAQIIFCFPALKVIEWRLDYSIIAGSFLTLTSYWIQFAAESSFFVTIASNCLLGLGQSLLIPLGPYFSQKWFNLQHRSFVIALNFYSNIFGLTFGGIFTALYIGDDQDYINKQIFIIALISTVIFILSILLIRNPTKKIQKYKKFSLEQIKFMWRQKFNVYCVFMASIFLGVSWNFVSISSIFLQIFSPLKVGILLIVWIVSGMSFGLVVAYLVDKVSSEKGSSFLNDFTFKVITFFAILGFVILGIIYSLDVQSYAVYIILMVVLGIGNLGSFGLIYLSFVQTLYPINSLVLGTIIAVGASIYSALISSLSSAYFMNAFYFMAIGLVFPWIYITVVYKTNFKRYKFYLNEKKAKYQLLKIQDNQSNFKNQ